ncbi:MAG: polymer-forming cytoskeletal protein [Candidatus Accumulibacter necessarius]|jgi:cytoskeletal protein CcmA (bactofilin family)|uniref:bactofilin family protein n=1 Tax=Candidatus Accumulibacter necessarius TaxID=2954386 RepID=UPI002FC32F35
MFNKPNVFNRNEPIARRDVQPSVGFGAQPSASPSGAPATAGRETAGKDTPPSNVVGPSAVSPDELSQHLPGAHPVRAANAPPPASAAAARESLISENMIGARLLVGPDVKLKGAEILDCDTLVVEGRVEATMDSRVIRVAENGAFVGKVSIDIAEIDGTFEGELTARSQLIIHSTGRVSGKIRYGKLVVDEGGEVSGDISTLSDHASPRGRPLMEALVAVNAAAG